MGDVRAAAVTYRVQHSNGVAVATGVTTDWGTCGQKPTTTRTTLLSTAAFDCADDEVNVSGITTHFEAIYNTAYAQNTTVTGTSFNPTLSTQGGGTYPRTLCLQLFYVNASGTTTRSSRRTPPATTPPAPCRPVRRQRRSATSPTS